MILKKLWKIWEKVNSCLKTIEPSPFLFLKRKMLVYSKYDFIEFLLGIVFFIVDNWWKVIILVFIFVAGIIKIVEWIIELV